MFILIYLVEVASGKIANRAFALHLIF